MSKYSEDEQIEQYIKHKQQKQQQTEETISKKDLLKVFDDNLNKLEEIHIKNHKMNNLLFNFQMLRDLIEFNKII
tara:strand:+ start:387 stop:611 length:225 start_codon:yes stop_codon:yes gene_type:complete